MRKLLMTFGLLAVAVPMTSATANVDDQRYRNREVRQEQRECRRELRRADSRREYNRELRECRRELQRARQSGRYQNWDRRWRNW
ncbi:hypothetical protein LQ953_08270 [Sphingomonas sp. IC-56]|uniref:hypothetical protein n=1 Tax=Sphingomonas sp. IC-56 TaxID=2898529 RepID=UPI001E2C7812|nr:hypothetical protein [Sphingomonas sp. IC-56]MCD2324003.1 hypothetical protein [Sphingomonas sp. IC-56]